MQVGAKRLGRGFERADQAVLDSEHAVIIEPFAIAVIDLTDQLAIAVFRDDEVHVAGAVRVMTHIAQQFTCRFSIRDRVGHRAHGDKGIVAVLVGLEAAAQIVFRLIRVEVFIDSVRRVFPDVECHTGNAVPCRIADIALIIGGFLVVVMLLYGRGPLGQHWRVFTVERPQHG